MLFNYTDEELKKLEQIKRKYALEIADLLISNTDTIEDIERKKQLRGLKGIELSNAIGEFNMECQAIRFKDIENDTEKIILNAKVQAPQIIEKFYTGISYQNENEDLTKVGILTKYNKKYLIKSSFAIELLKNELALHLKALQNDKKNLEIVTNLILDTALNSEYTAHEKVESEILEKLSLDISDIRENTLTAIKTYSIMNDKVTAHIIKDDGFFTQDLTGQMSVQWDINQASNNQTPVPVYLQLSYEGTNAKLSKKLTSFDNAVYNAISTIKYYWDKKYPNKPLYISPNEIWRIMNGKDSNDGHIKPSATQIKKICDSMDKMRYTSFYMDIKEEIKAHNISINDSRITDGIIESYLLNSDKVTFKTEKGNIITGYSINKEPIMYTYNKAKDHLLYMPYDLLDTSSEVQNTEYVAEFRNYLLQQIQLMKNSENKRMFQRNNIILIDTIYKDLGIKPPIERVGNNFTKPREKQKAISKCKSTDRNKIEGILKVWIKKGWIKDFCIMKEKNKNIKGYEIIL